MAEFVIPPGIYVPTIAVSRTPDGRRFAVHVPSAGIALPPEGLGEFICRKCKARFHEWTSQCDYCGARNATSVVRERADGTVEAARAVSASELEVEPFVYIATGYPQTDDLLGGGFVRGRVLFLAGDPGAGKTSLALNFSERCAAERVLYAYTEGEIRDVRVYQSEMGCERDGILLFESVRCEEILGAAADEGADLLVVDSLGELSCDESDAEPGTPPQTRACIQLIREWASKHDAAALVLGHTTMDGAMAGGRKTQHRVHATATLKKAAKGVRVLRMPKSRQSEGKSRVRYARTGDGFVELEDTPRDGHDDADAEAVRDSHAARRRPVEDSGRGGSAGPRRPARSDRRGRDAR
jgi:DNA repair protein RadA/Sms